MTDSIYDFFQGGQQWWNIGVMNQRSYRSSMYLGIQQIKGATLDSQILTNSYSYLMSPKYLSTISVSYDLAQHAKHRTIADVDTHRRMVPVPPGRQLRLEQEQRQPDVYS